MVVCAQHEAGGGGECAAGPDCGSPRRQEAGGGGKLGKVHVLGKCQVRQPQEELEQLRPPRPGLLLAVPLQYDHSPFSAILEIFPDSTCIVLGSYLQIRRPQC